ncbi:unnamed protein product [Anisakis simplex]|uniref:Uncharacterized protein n=1 Tax=Anisakis simplex TaxID=6269 RepID=A0A0M3KHL0_ANISI|nr:unnamed protein product [Anisakis simplex]
MEIPIASRRSTAAKKATASSSLNGGGGDVKTTNTGVDEHSSETGKVDGDSKEADATTTSLHDENDMVDEGEAVNPFPEKSPPAASAADGAKSSGSGMKPVVKAESEVDKILGMAPMNTTAQHRFHLFDMNCDICTGKRDRELAQRKQKREKRDRRASRSGNTVVGGGGADLTATSPSKTPSAMQLLTTVS